jgi:bla regulator protein blaR1
MKAVQFKDGQNFLATNVSLRDLVQYAFHVQAEQVAGGPAWTVSEKFDVNAKLDTAELQNRQQLSSEQKLEDLRNRLQAMLTERFQLAVRHETKSIPVYALVVASGGPKLKVADPGNTYPNGIKLPSGKPIVPGIFLPKPGELVAQGLSISSFVSTLSSKNLGRLIVDKTGLIGNYDFTLNWTPEPSAASPNASLFAALEEQLGLKLVAQDNPMEVIVIERAEKPITAAQARAGALKPPQY